MPAKTETKAEETKAVKWLVVVNNAPAYCGVGAGGVQFANGQAVIESERMTDILSQSSSKAVII